MSCLTTATCKDASTGMVLAAVGAAEIAGPSSHSMSQVCRDGAAFEFPSSSVVWLVVDRVTVCVAIARASVVRAEERRCLSFHGFGVDFIWLLQLFVISFWVWWVQKFCIVLGL